MRRIAELLMMMVIPLAVLFLPILVSVWAGGGTLYEWTNESFVEETGFNAVAWANKTGYLNPEFFTPRAIVYLGLWIAMATYYFKGSSRQDETGERVITERLQARSGPALILLSLSMSFAMFDWVMSLAPTWFSTMFGVYLFAGAMLLAHCAIAVASFVLQSRGALRDEITVEHYHDLGKYIFGFVFFWTYIAFSQYMLIWYANMPEETEWFFDRQEGVLVLRFARACLLALDASVRRHDESPRPTEPEIGRWLGLLPASDALCRYLLDHHAGSRVTMPAGRWG